MKTDSEQSESKLSKGALVGFLLLSLFFIVFGLQLFLKGFYASDPTGFFFEGSGYRQHWMSFREAEVFGFFMIAAGIYVILSCIRNLKYGRTRRCS